MQSCDYFFQNSQLTGDSREHDTVENPQSVRCGIDQNTLPPDIRFPAASQVDKTNEGSTGIDSGGRWSGHLLRTSY